MAPPLQGKIDVVCDQTGCGHVSCLFARLAGGLSSQHGGGAEHQHQPDGEIPPAAEAAGVADGGNDSAGDHRSDAGNGTRKIIIPHDAEAYRHRNRIERGFNRLKHFRRFATRYDSRTVHFKGFTYLAAAMI